MRGAAAPSVTISYLMGLEPINALTIDFEDWYQGLEIPYQRWGEFEDRIEMVGDKLLRILNEARVKATFFMLGYVAEKHPEIVRRIEAEGHEIGTHGFSHRRDRNFKPAVFLHFRAAAHMPHTNAQEWSSE